MRKHFAALLTCAMLLLASSAQGALSWPVLSTPGQLQVQSLVQSINEHLASLGAPQVNSLFESYPALMIFGVTGQDDAAMPEGTELTFTLNGDVLTAITLRTSNISSFAALAASCIQAVDPTLTQQEAMATPSEQMRLATTAPDNSFGESMGDTDWLQGEQLRAYYSYRPNEYHDNTNWIQMVLIPPMGSVATPTPTLAPTATPAPILEDGEEPTETPREATFTLSPI